MKRIYLPLHVWDREFDSRLVIAYVEACKGNTAILGHEYNMAPLYEVDDGAILFRAGGPLDHSIRGKWHNQVHNNGGIVMTQDEEGINNMPFIFKQKDGSKFAALDLAKIQERPNLSGIKAFEDVKFQLAWSNLHRSCQCHQVQNIESRSIAINKILSTSSVRFDLIGELGRILQNRLVQSIQNVYQNYVLVLDNFSVDQRGRKGINDPSKDLRENGWSDQQIKEYKTKIEKNRIIEARARSDYLKLIEELALENPDINFIFRPHPVLDSTYWHAGIGNIKNVSIVEKGSIHAWIYGATATIHSGCTTGLEAFAAKIPTLDVSSLISPRSSSIKASLIGQAANIHTSHADIKRTVRSLWKRKHSSNLSNQETSSGKEAFAHLEMANPIDHVLAIFERNSQLVAQRIQDQLALVNGDHVIGSNSALSTIIKVSTQSRNSRIQNISHDIFNNKVKKEGPNLGKSRFVSLKEVKTRINHIKEGFDTLGFKSRPVQVRKIGINTFLIYQELSSQ